MQRNLEVIRILEDPDVPVGVANKAYRAAEKNTDSALVVGWSPYRWKAAGEAWEKRTGRTAVHPRFIETDRERWDPAERYAFPDKLAAYLTARPGIELLIVADDFVVLPAGMPGGHTLGSTVGWCPICKLWSDGKGGSC